MKKILVVCFLVLLVLSGCNSNEQKVLKELNNELKNEMTRLETKISELEGQLKEKVPK